MLYASATYNSSIEYCTFINNTLLNLAGAAIYLSLPGDLTITKCVFSRNIAPDGSAIYYEETNPKKLVLNSNSFDQNLASDNGAALFISVSSTVIIENCNFMKNIIPTNLQNPQNLGSVLFLSNPGNLSIIYSKFENNIGILGTCIYYSETSWKKKLFYLKF